MLIIFGFLAIARCQVDDTLPSNTGIEAGFMDFNTPDRIKDPTIPKDVSDTRVLPITISDGIELPPFGNLGNTNQSAELALINESEAPDVTVSDGIPTDALPGLNVTHAAKNETTKKPPRIRSAPICWRAHYSRGAGKIPNRCPEGTVRKGLLCHEKCKAGYKGVGFLCWKDCPIGYHNDGLTCQRVKPLHIQKRERYSRGIGKHMVCPPDKDLGAGLCYKKCKKEYTGIGTVCWNKCPGNLPINCGAFCAQNVLMCAGGIFQMVTATSEVFANAVAIIITAGAFVPLKASLTTAMTGKKIIAEAGEAAAGISVQQFGALLHLKWVMQAFKFRVVEELVTTVATGTPYQWASLDPTGIQAVITAFRHPVCPS